MWTLLKYIHSSYSDSNFFFSLCINTAENAFWKLYFSLLFFDTPYIWFSCARWHNSYGVTWLTVLMKPQTDLMLVLLHLSHCKETILCSISHPMVFRTIKSMMLLMPRWLPSMLYTDSSFVKTLTTFRPSGSCWFLWLLIWKELSRCWTTCAMDRLEINAGF